MWLLTTLAAALISTFFWYFTRKKYRLDILSLMLWGGTVMILVDRVLGYEGGEFLKTETDGMVSSGFLLGLIMLIPVLIVWASFLLISKRRR